MKKVINIYAIATLLFLFADIIDMYGQSSSASNNYQTNYFLGWNTTNGLNPLQIRTNNLMRITVNGNLNYNGAYFPAPGFFGWLTANYPTYTLGAGNKPSGFIGINTDKPQSRLHISGVTTVGPGTGWRPWMQNGVFMNERSNNMYVGMYHLPTASSEDAVMNWGDDGAGTGNRLRVIFTPTTGILPGTQPLHVKDQEMMSFWVNRNVGIGDFINFTTGPQSHLHLHNAFADNDYLQITSTTSGAAGTDGLRLGITGTNNEAHIRQQENSHIRLFTNAATALNERMRITQIGAPGLNNPGAIANNLTRISISHDPSNPVSQPLSLLHLGYNVTGFISPLNGWRPWMDVGAYISQGTDNMYIGLKKETSSNPNNQGDRYDAVINWGDNMVNPVLQEGPDNLRFIFTSGVNDPFGSSQSKSVNGVEVMRLTPNNVVNNPNVINKPSVGIGDFTAAAINANNYVGATLDVDGDARIRSVQQNETLNQVLVRDPNDYGRMYWRDANNLSGANANNGCSIDPLNAGIVQWGQDINAAGNPAQLLNNREIPMMDNNVYFLGQHPTQQGINSVGIGYPSSVAQLPARLSVWENPGQPVAYHTVGVLGRNSSASPILEGPYYYIGVAGMADGVDLPENKNKHIGGYFSSDGGVVNYGVMGLANTGNPTNSNINYGGFFVAQANANMSNNTGVYGTASNGFHPRGGFFSGSNGSSTTAGIEGSASGLSTSSTYYAGKFTSNAVTGATQYGIYAEAPIDSGFSYAGWFQGDVHVTGTFTNPSDAVIKTNVQSLNNVSQQLQQLQPISFEYSNAAVPQLNLSAGSHYGLIAQQVEQVFPQLVQNTRVAPVSDSLGQVIHAATTVKSVNYIEIIPLLIEAFQEQQQKIVQQDSLMQSMQQQLQLLTGMITNCCNQAQPMQTPVNNNAQPYIQHEYTMEVTLRNDDMIVLNQNAPNPFKEQTTISWYLPERIQRAQLIFTNNLGQVIQMTDIRETGHGRMIVYADDLSSGLYNYSLVVDGKIVETKRMIKVD